MAGSNSTARLQNSHDIKCFYGQLAFSLRSPEKINYYTNKGSQFFSSEWKDTITFLGMPHIHSTAYHPQSNGLAERTI